MSLMLMPVWIVLLDESAEHKLASWEENHPKKQMIPSLKLTASSDLTIGAKRDNDEILGT